MRAILDAPRIAEPVLTPPAASRFPEWCVGFFCSDPVVWEARSGDRFQVAAIAHPSAGGSA